MKCQNGFMPTNISSAVRAG